MGSTPVATPVYNNKDLCVIKTEADRTYTPSTIPTYIYFIKDSILIDSTSSPSFTPGITSLDDNMLTKCSNVCQSYRFDTSGTL